MNGSCQTIASIELPRLVGGRDIARQLWKRVANRATSTLIINCNAVTSSSATFGDEINILARDYPAARTIVLGKPASWPTVDWIEYPDQLPDDIETARRREIMGPTDAEIATLPTRNYCGRGICALLEGHPGRCKY